jgi:S1-C subfamily serine protease
MKWQFVLIVVLAAAIGGVAGNLSTHYAYAQGEDDQQKIIEAVKHDGPSVVALDVVANGTRIAPSNPLGMLFGQPGSEKVVPFHERASGSGFVYDKSGLILTDDHVVHGAQKITAIFENGDKAPATIFGEDPDNDVALVKVNYDKLPPPLPLGDSSKIQRGQWTIAIGEPLELQQTVTIGVASAIGRNEQITTDTGTQRSFKNLLQTSAPINPGNSGGPLLNLDGEVIAINQSVAQPAQGIGFAVPANTIKESIALIEKHPGVNRQEAGFMGVQLVSVDNKVRQVLHYNGGGAAVAGVISGSSAEKAGLQTGDIIQAINGKKIANAKESIQIVSAMPPGTVVHLQVWSKGREHNVDVRLSPRPIQ